MTEEAVEQPLIHDNRTASVEAWKLATLYLDDMATARKKCMDVLNSIKKRNDGLHEYLKKGTFEDEEGNERPLTPTEICNFHRCIGDTEKTTVMISTTIIRDANRDTFMEFIRKVKALSLIHI